MPSRSQTLSQPLLHTPLHAAHVTAGGRMVAFGGYDMPVQYPLGVLGEHRWTREHAGLFDVSHMGPSFLGLITRTGDGEVDHKAISAVIEPLVSGDIAGLKPGQIRYTVLLNDKGGIDDDLMIGRPAHPDRQGELYVVVNAGTKLADFARIEAAAHGVAELQRADDGGLIAVQGPEAVDVVAKLWPAAADQPFMTFAMYAYGTDTVVVSRSGYTGEDGYEILVPREAAERLWTELSADERGKPVGLGARDSLRLEAGLPLYGHDLDDTVSPVEASLNFAISKRRRTAGNLLGAERIEAELEGQVERVRVGLKVLTGAPAREGAEIADNGHVIGRVTSGGFSPTLGVPIAMGFVPPQYRAVGTAVQVLVRGKPLLAHVVPLPFVPNRYVRKTPA